MSYENRIQIVNSMVYFNSMYTSINSIITTFIFLDTTGFDHIIFYILIITHTSHIDLQTTVITVIIMIRHLL